MLKEEKILGVKINTGFTMQSALDHIENVLLKDGKKHYICTTNSEFVVDSQRDPAFKQILNNADLSLPDSAGILFALEYKKRLQRHSKLKKSPLFPVLAFFEGTFLGLEGLLKSSVLGERIPGRLLVDKLCELSSKHGHSAFFLGGRMKDVFGKDIADAKDVATLAADKIRQKYPNVHIIGSTSGFSRESKDDQSSVAYINKCMQNNGISTLDILLVAYNHKYQEKWILRNINRLPVRICIGVGGTFDYLANIKSTSPDILVKRNLDWFFRLLTQPWRYKRIFKAFPAFPWSVFLDSLK